MDIVEDILKAQKYEDLLTEENPVSYKAFAKLVHPDVCKDPRASDAMSKLAKMYQLFNSGQSFADDSGEYVSNYYWAEYKGNQNVIDFGRKKQELIYSKSTFQLKRYMPYSWETENKIFFLDRAIPLSNQTFEQKHVNWIVSRLIEFSMLLHRHTQHAHLGITPDNLFVVPETHGVSVAGFYHCTQLGKRIGTVSGKYKSWYPASVFKDKIATEATDIRMIKSVAAYIMGDRSGVGTMLKRTHNKDYVDFLLTTHTDSKKCFTDYREMVDANFKKEFHILSL